MLEEKQHHRGNVVGLLFGKKNVLRLDLKV